MTDLPVIGDPTLSILGWGDDLDRHFANHATAGRTAARVVSEGRGHFILHDGTTTFEARVSGRLRHESGGDPLAYPAVGDWVAVARRAGSDTATIHALVPRRSAIVRHAPTDHGTAAQVIAANVDVVFIVSSLNAELSLRRLERYLAVAWESGAIPVVVLSKADLDDDIEGHRAAVGSIAPGVEVIVASAVTGDGIAAVAAHLAVGRTVAFIGSSGVGKSTLVNRLAGYELFTTAGIREDDARGRHTTTRRQLVRLADGLVIDTPGMREMALLDGDGLAAAFGDIEETARRCRFSDCRHDQEPGCAVRSAIAEGSLEPARFDSFRKLEREARRSELANDVVARKAERKKWTTITKSVARHMAAKYGDDR